MAKKAKKKKAKKKSRAQQKKEKREEHKRTLQGDICKRFRAWYDEMWDKGWVMPCIEDTWIDMAGWVVQMALDEKWRYQRSALERGLEKRAEYLISKEGHSTIGLRQLVDPGKKGPQRIGELIEKGLALIQTERRAERKREAPGVMRLGPGRKLKHLPGGFPIDCIVQHRQTHNYGVVREGRGFVGVRWVVTNSDGYLVRRPVQLDEGCFEGEYADWKIKRVPQVEARGVKAQWQKLKKAGRLKVEE